MKDNILRFVVNIFALAFLVGVLSSPLILAGNITSQGVPWQVSSDFTQSKLVKVEIAKPVKGAQEITLNFGPEENVISEYKNFISIISVADTTIQVSVEKLDEAPADLFFDSQKQVVVLRPGEQKFINLSLEPSAFKPGSSARFTLRAN